MLVDQIAVFVENKVGSLDKLIELLANNDINIDSLTVSEDSDFGIVKIITKQNKRATEVLETEGYTYKKTKLIAFEVDDKPGSLQKFLKILSANNIQIEYIYSHTLRGEKGLILFKTKDMKLAEEVLSKIDK